MENADAGADVGAGGPDFTLRQAGYQANSYGYWADAQKINNNTNTSYGVSYTVGDIIGVALDLDASPGTITFYKNNATQGVAYSNLTDGNVYAPQTGEQSGAATSVILLNAGQDSSFAGNKTSGSAEAQDANEKGDFYYTPPSNHLALCSDNLPDPEIALPGEYFNTLLYSGTGGSGQSLTGVGFQPEMMFLKRRTTAGAGWGAMDVVRGAEASSSLSKLTPNATTAEESSGDTYDVISFDSDGFTVGEGYNLNVNVSGQDYATWNWKAGGAPTATNSAGVGAVPTAGSVKIDGSNLGSALAGTIAATRLSANTTSGFSIVSYTGNGSSGATVAHGLSQAPNLIITKSLDEARSWPVGSSALTGSVWGYHLYLDSTGAEVDAAAMFNDTAPSSSIFTLGDDTDINNDTHKMIAYCFHSIEGYSKVGSYEGNGNVDGTFIYTGMKPAYILIKRIDDTSQWWLWDNKREDYDGNPNDTILQVNNNSAENDSTDQSIDFLSNGFKIRNASNLDNNSSGTYLFLAFAESPFKTSNAR